MKYGDDLHPIPTRAIEGRVLEIEYHSTTHSALAFRICRWLRALARLTAPMIG